MLIQSSVLSLVVLNLAPAGLAGWICSQIRRLQNRFYSVYALLLLILAASDMYVVASLEMYRPFAHLLSIPNVYLLLLGITVGISIYLFEYILRFSSSHWVSRKKTSFLGNTSRTYLNLTSADHSFSGATMPALITSSTKFLIVFVAIMEEIVYRYFLLVYFLSTFDLILSVAAISTIYGLTHVAYGLRNILSKTVEGIIYSTQVLLTASIYGSIVSHTVFNLLAVMKLRTEKVK